MDGKPLHAAPELIDDDDYDTGTWSKQFRNPLYDYHDAEMAAAEDYEPGTEKVHTYTGFHLMGPLVKRASRLISPLYQKQTYDNVD